MKLNESDKILKDNELLKKQNEKLKQEAETARNEADSTQQWYYSKARALTEKENTVERLKREQEYEILRHAQEIADRQVFQIKDELESEHQKALREFKEKAASLKEENDETVKSASFILVTAVLAIITAIFVSDTMIADIITACKILFHPVLVTGYKALMEISGVRNIVLFALSAGLYIVVISFLYEFFKQNIELFKPYFDDVTLFLTTAFFLLSELIMTTFHFANIIGIWALACAVYLTLRIIITERKKKKQSY
ncbi:hypothetical protein CXIVA_07790 [Clostridium sp. SY8519]|uniref:hypothetical protein n=1 Tax=Clostridium sp. (strain SY8519) TaxID=1042156 RepID=UPI0002172027|nr:hypothetical protein [Clostridium sp. SY8519]BAK46746.1 hypothetical protein CXIVA_07790 [Clostridium sp. SY8519]